MPGPTFDGAKFAFQEPEAVFIEIAWRMIFAAVAITVGFMGIRGFMKSLVVFKGDLLLSPRLTLGHMLVGGGRSLAHVLVVCFLAISALWLACASLGRTAILERLAEKEFHPGIAILGLNFLRLCIHTAAALALLGMVIEAGAIANKGYLPVALVAGLLIGSVTWWIRGVLDELLTIASLFVARNKADCAESIILAFNVYQRRSFDITMTQIILSAVRAVVFILAMFAWLWLSELASGAPLILKYAVTAFVLLLYLGSIDFLQIANVGALRAILIDEQVKGGAIAIYRHT